MPRDFRHGRAALAEVPSGSEGQRECARQAWCTGYRLVPSDDGTSKRAPGLTYQAFCQPDTTLIAGHLSGEQDLLAAYGRLAAELGDPSRRGQMIRVPFGPRMLLSEYYDLLMRRILEVLCCYEERVRTAARLVPLDTRVSALRAIRSGHQVVADSCRILSVHLSALLALPPGPVLRHIPSGELKAVGNWRATSPVLDLWQDAVVCANRDGMATILAETSGAGAGTEIIDLHRRCLTALGEVATHPEILDGVPCRVCGNPYLERAEPPSDPETEADYSRCPSLSCRDRMKLDIYRQWVRRYEAWARSLGPLTCQRCSNQDCGQCIYPGCECAAEGHRAAA